VLQDFEIALSVLLAAAIHVQQMELAWNLALKILLEIMEFVVAIVISINVVIIYAAA